jgi:hypothetical protein
MDERNSYQSHLSKLSTDYESKILDLQREIGNVEEREVKRRVAREQVR